MIDWLTENIIAIIQTILALGAFIYAYQEFKHWRIQLLGSKRIDLAIELGETALKIKHAFYNARNPFTFGEKSLEEDYNQRLALISEELQDLYEIQAKVIILLGDDIEDYVKEYNQLFSKLKNAMYLSYKERASDGDMEIVFRSTKDDEFGNEVEKHTEKILKFIRRYV